MSKEPELAIILVNYNGWSWLAKCLDSFKNLTNWQVDHPEGMEIIVVDNGSKQELLNDFVRQYPWINPRQLKSNLGFAAGNNVGLQLTKAPVVMLLNTDTEFLPGTNLFSLLTWFNNKNVAVVSPRVILADGRLDHACHRGFPTPWNAFAYYSGLAKLFPKTRLFGGYRMSWANLSQPHQIDAGTGAAMLVRNIAIDQVGLLDENFFMYAEDIDWCYRFKDAGFEVWFDPNVQILHHKHKSGQKNKNWDTRSRTIRAFFDTMNQFMRKHYSQRYSGLVLWFVSVMIEILKQQKLIQERIKYAVSKS